MLRPALAPGQRVVAAGTAAALAAVICAGCTASPETSSPSTPPQSADSASAEATPSPTPHSPASGPDGPADDQLAAFRSVTEAVWNSSEQGSGRAYIDALVTSGFDKAAMQVTNDTTTLGEPAESIQFSVLWSDGRCLVGQVGPATGAPVTAVLPAVGDSMCLLGQTRPIDW